MNANTQDLAPTVVGMTYLGFLSQLAPDVVFGAFTGAIVFLLGVRDKPKWLWLVFFVAAFMTGLLGGGLVSSILTGAFNLIRIPVIVSDGIGALLSAACALNFITWIRDNPTFFFNKSKGGAA